MESIEFSQDELKIIISVFNACQIKLGDASLMLPIAQKIQSKIKEEPKVETPTVNSVTNAKQSN